MVDPSVVATQRLTITVVTNGRSQGRTAEDPAGTAIDVALGASQSTVENTFLNVLGR